MSVDSPSLLVIGVNPTSGLDNQQLNNLTGPVRSIKKAFQLARLARSSGQDVIVELKTGVYREGLLELDHSLSGRLEYPFVFRAAAGAKPILSGARQLPQAAWVRVGSTPVYYRNLPSTLRFRELYRDGTQLRPARMPNIEDWNGDSAPSIRSLHNSLHQWSAMRNQQGVELIPDALLTGSAVQDAEIVIPVAWGMTRMRLESVTVSDGKVTLTPRAYEGGLETYRFSVYTDHESTDQRFFLERSRHFLDQEGEWAIDSTQNRLYVYSTTNPSGSDFEYGAEPTLLKVTGAKFVYIEGLTFEKTGYSAADQIGYVSDGSGCSMKWENGAVVQCGYNTLPAALDILNGQVVFLQNVTFRNLAANGLKAVALSYSQIVNSSFQGVGAAGLLLYGVHNIKIAHNSFTAIGFQYTSDAITAISTSDGQQNIFIDDNHFTYLAGRGIYLIQPPELMFPDSLPSQNSSIRRNVINSALNRIQDAGAINVGYITGVQIANNQISGIYNRQWNIGPSRSNAIYLDVGTYWSQVTQNTISSSQVGIQLNCQHMNSISGNTLTDVATPNLTTNIFCVQAAPASRQVRMQNVLSCGSFDCGSEGQ